MKQNPASINFFKMGRKSVNLVPTASAGRIIEKAGAERVSDEGAAMLAETLTEIGMQISEMAIRLAQHAGRKTVKSEDIKLAVSNMKKGI